MIEVYVDGSCPNNQADGLQPTAYGFIVFKDGEEIYQEGNPGELGTNNTAEYTALINALEWLVQNCLSAEQIVIYSDSQLVVNQINGIYAVNSENLFTLWHHAILLLNDFEPGQVKVVWVPRERNLAHELAESSFISW